MAPFRFLGVLVVAVAAAALAGCDAQHSGGHGAMGGRAATRALVRESAWSEAALRNLSMWRSTLFERTERFMVAHGNTGDIPAHDRFAPYEPFVSCPPNMPLRRHGGAGDGGKLICGLDQIQAPCTILSLGSSNDYTFEEAVLAVTPCAVVTFDCTVDGRSVSPRHKFFKTCISGAEESHRDPRMVNYEQLLSMVGTDSMELLKIDIESYEFPVFADWNERTRGLPHQISVEVHYDHFQSLDPLFGRSNFKQAELSLFFGHMANLGYAIVAKEINPDCNACSEYTFIRIEQSVASMKS